jgi:predicted RNA-binding protein with PUA-like domain
MAFDKQQQDMNTRALKPHSSDCEDPWDCKKDVCFVPSPDKIIQVSSVKRKTDEERRKEVYNGEARVKTNLKRLKYGMQDGKK